MLTALRVGLVYLKSIHLNLPKKDRLFSRVPLSTLSGLWIAFLIVYTGAQWPEPDIPLEIDGLLPFESIPTQEIAWIDLDDTDQNIEPEIPPELFPEYNTNNDPLIIASIDLPSDLHGIEIKSAPVVGKTAVQPPVEKPKTPPAKGIVHKVRVGENLWEISKAYNVSTNKVVMYNPDVDPRRMMPGDEIFIPGAKDSLLLTSKKRMISPIAEAYIVSGYGLRKHPLGGVLRFHRGVDMPSNVGTPIRAVLDGVVVFAGWQGSKTGNVVEIKHSDGIHTLYAHNSKINVRTGDRVSQGQVISYVGTTGRVTGAHLHFEVIKNGKHEDPERYLPRLPHK